jgi:hypothetical protein
MASRHLSSSDYVIPPGWVVVGGTPIGVHSGFHLEQKSEPNKHQKKIQQRSEEVLKAYTTAWQQRSVTASSHRDLPSHLPEARPVVASLASVPARTAPSGPPNFASRPIERARPIADVPHNTLRSPASLGMVDSSTPAASMAGVTSGPLKPLAQRKLYQESVTKSTAANATSTGVHRHGGQHPQPNQAAAHDFSMEAEQSTRKSSGLSSAAVTPPMPMITASLIAQHRWRQSSKDSSSLSHSDIDSEQVRESFPPSVESPPRPFLSFSSFPESELVVDAALPAVASPHWPGLDSTPLSVLSGSSSSSYNFSIDYHVESSYNDSNWSTESCGGGFDAQGSFVFNTNGGIRSPLRGDSISPTVVTNPHLADDFEPLAAELLDAAEPPTTAHPPSSSDDERQAGVSPAHGETTSAVFPAGSALNSRSGNATSNDERGGVVDLATEYPPSAEGFLRSFQMKFITPPILYELFVKAASVALTTSSQEVNPQLQHPLIVLGFRSDYPMDQASMGQDSRPCFVCVWAKSASQRVHITVEVPTFRLRLALGSDTEIANPFFARFPEEIEGATHLVPPPAQLHLLDCLFSCCYLGQPLRDMVQGVPVVRLEDLERFYEVTWEEGGGVNGEGVDRQRSPGLMGERRLGWCGELPPGSGQWVRRRLAKLVKRDDAPVDIPVPPADGPVVFFTRMSESARGTTLSPSFRLFSARCHPILLPCNTSATIALSHAAGNSKGYRTAVAGSGDHANSRAMAEMMRCVSKRVLSNPASESSAWLWTTGEAAQHHAILPFPQPSTSGRESVTPHFYTVSAACDMRPYKERLLAALQTMLASLDQFSSSSPSPNALSLKGRLIAEGIHHESLELCSSLPHVLTQRMLDILSVLHALPHHSSLALIHLMRFACFDGTLPSPHLAAPS